MAGGIEMTYSITRVRFAHSILLSIWNDETDELVLDVMSNEVGGASKAREIINNKLRELGR